MNAVDYGLWAVDPEEADFDDHIRKSRDRWFATYSVKALKQGVGRVRILPAAEADALPQFYLTKLSCGTEVTCA